MYLAIMILVLVLAIALSTSTILVSQLRMAREIGNSVIAFFAADTGIERGLYEGQSVPLGNLENGASYDVQFIPPGPECSTPYYCLKSVGLYQKTRRAIEVGR